MNRNNEGNLTEKAPSAKNGKPAGLPDKFWDENSGKINLEALLEDYNSMASRDENQIESHNRRMPESYDKYEVKFPHPLLDRDDEIFRRFFENGFTNEQAQLVYDLANERVIPVLDSLASDYEAERQLEKLKRFFGSEENSTKSAASFPSGQRAAFSLTSTMRWPRQPTASSPFTK